MATSSVSADDVAPTVGDGSLAGVATDRVVPALVLPEDDNNNENIEDEEIEEQFRHFTLRKQTSYR